MIWKFIFVINICIMVYSCSNYHYAVVSQYVPLNTEKGELTANINLRNLQLGYSLANNFAIHALMYADIIYDSVENGRGFFSADDYINTYYRNSNNVMLGGSYFMNRYKFIFELLGGAGIGSTHYRNYTRGESEYWTRPYHFSMYSKNIICYVQPDIGFKFCKYVNLGLSGKLTLMTYKIIDRTLELGDYSDPSNTDRILLYNNTVNQYFFEPALTIRTGLEKIKFQTQFISAFSLNNPDFELSRLKIILSFFVCL